jgi:hypothetical protein
VKTRRSFLAKCAFFVAGCAFSVGVERRAIAPALKAIPNPAWESAKYEIVFFDYEMEIDPSVLRPPCDLFTCQKMQKAASLERVHPEPKDVVPA